MGHRRVICGVSMHVSKVEPERVADARYGEHYDYGVYNNKYQSFSTYFKGVLVRIHVSSAVYSDADSEPLPRFELFRRR